MLADGTVEEGMEITAADLPVVTLGDFLENVSLLSAVDVDDEDSDNKVALMTVHSSKGLEFPYVFVTGLEENLFPSGGYMASESEIEEERRLCYVAMTRAKKVLQLSFASTRMRNGKHETNSPSRFVREINEKYILNPLRADEFDDENTGFGSKGGWGNTFAGNKQTFNPVNRSRMTSHTGNSTVRNAYGTSGPVKIERSRPSEPVRKPGAPTPFRRPQVVAKRVPDSEFVPSPIMDLKAGQRVEHNRFGLGKILEISGSPTDLKAKIIFDEYGEKILLLKYAKIRIV